MGLTGGIAAGKSTIAAIFREFGAAVLDADEVARQVVAPGEPALAEVVRHFGAGMLKADGTLDRDRLAAVVFGSKKELRALNRIMHPRIGRALEARIRRLEESAGRPDVVVVEAAVLRSPEWDMKVDRTIGVVTKHSVQVARLIERYGPDNVRARQRLRSQISPSELRACSDFLIPGDLSLEETRAQAEVVWAALVRETARLHQKTTAVSAVT